MSHLTRRKVLRGVLQGGAVSLAVPFLNCFLNGNGTALASGAPLPVRFGTWFWGLGMNHKIFVPTHRGADYDVPEEMAALQAVRQHVNVFSNFRVIRDSSPNICHHTGWVTLRTGVVPTNANDFPGETIDVTVANQIGGATRFRSLTATATADIRDSCSYEGQNAPIASEASPLGFYQRLFGPDFQDPNGASFTPNPRIMLKKSVLSGVMEEARSLTKTVGVEDRARLDQYFTGLRELERQLDHQLTKPEPIAACVRPPAPPEDLPPGVDVEVVAARHRIMTDLMSMAVACDQTRVFNMVYSNPFAATIKEGEGKSHHAATHEDPEDAKVGYQLMPSWYTRRAIEAWSYFVSAFEKIKEGDGSLLDNALIYANSDQELAKTHSVDGIPMFTAGRAGGRLKSGFHIDGAGDPGTRLGYTLMRVMGIEIASWGTQSNKTSKDIGDILA